uniref:Uncharacterized protein n=1 Tax=Paramormyrops kingsleyae TaxID=1676925 RepID=A0A3B3QN07_9TELE
MIQSCFLLHLGLWVFTGFLIRGVGARRMRLWRALISLKKAFSLVCLPMRLNPSVLGSTARPRSVASNSKQSWAMFLKFLNSFQMSNTSHFGASLSSITRDCSRVAFCLPAAQVKSFRLKTPAERALRGSASRFRRTRSSAPNKPSFSRELMLKSSLGTQESAASFLPRPLANRARLDAALPCAEISVSLLISGGPVRMRVILAPFVGFRAE